MNRREMIAASAAALLAGPHAAWARDYPARPVRLIVPYPPGQASDVIARLLAERISPALGQPVIVENRPGAGGNIGTETGARAAADGYTLTIATAALPISKLVYRKLSFDPIADFAPVTLMTITPLVLVTAPTLPVASVAELVEYARKNPGKLTFASSGPGTSHQLSGELFGTLVGAKLVHVPYKGSAPAHIDLMSGTVDLMFDNIVAVSPHVRSGKLRALAVTTKTRAPSLPDVPTMGEAGFAGFEAVAWFGALAPKGTPEAIVQRLNLEFVRALNLPEVRQKLVELGAQVVASRPEEFARFMDAESARWDPVVRRAQIALE